MNTALCVVAIRKGKHVPTCSASNNGSSQERALLVEWRKINSLQKQFKCHRSFAHTFFHKYQIGKHCQHQKNPTSQDEFQQELQNFFLVNFAPFFTIKMGKKILKIQQLCSFWVIHTWLIATQASGKQNLHMYGWPSSGVSHLP